MNILGISCFYHDAAACLIQDGKIVAAASEERFNRRKNSPLLPLQAINFCLQQANLTAFDIDYLGFYEKPFLKFSRVILSHLRAYPGSCKNFLDTLPYWLQDRLSLPLILSQELGYTGKILFIKHHLAHAASAFLVSPFEEAAILTADAVGEWATTVCGVGRSNHITMLRELRFPDSLGLLYTAVTTYLGFEALEGEGKVMGLAGYGQPVYLDKLKQIVKLHADASFSIDESYFGFNQGQRMYSRKFVELFGRQRPGGAEIQARHCDIASSLQRFTEDILVGIVRALYQELKVDKLCLAGGMFLNCVANARILQDTPFKEVFIQPAAGDSGGALGAAAYIDHCLLGHKRQNVMQDAFLGPEFTNQTIRQFLIQRGIQFQELDDQELAYFVASQIAQSKLIGRFQGRMEFGPRALGNRSILAHPGNPDMKEIINTRIKQREPFRPYAPAVLEERAGEFFEAKQFSPFMLLAASVRKDKQALIPAVTHIDQSARVQVVSRRLNPKFWGLIKEFEKLTGIPMLINTSFNLRGEPIVCTPQDALGSFLQSKMDCLVLENCVILRQ